MLEEKEKKKREVAELKERRKVIREERKKKILEAQERVTRKKSALLNSSATVYVITLLYFQVQSILRRKLKMLMRCVKRIPVMSLCVINQELNGCSVKTAANGSIFFVLV